MQRLAKKKVRTMIKVVGATVAKGVSEQAKQIGGLKMYSTFDPAKLKRLIVDLIDKENWSALGHRHQGRRLRGAAVKGAADISSGAGQYFTPRAADPGDRRRASTPSPATRSSTRPAAPAASCSSRTSTPPATPET